jgi:putative ABC transport system substrate-binding protein
MKRRQVMMGIGSAVILWSLRGVAQKQDVRIVGLLSPFTREESEPWHRTFQRALGELGWNEGVNVRFEYRYSDGHNDRLPALVAELIDSKPDVLVVTVNTDALPAAKATKTIPIVMASAGDPVATGLITSLAHPGGNVTGLTQIDTALAAKRLQLLKEVAPEISRVAVLWDPSVAVSSAAWDEIQDAAHQLHLTLHSLEVRNSANFDAALTASVEARDDALLTLQGPIFVVNERRVAEFAVNHRLPSIFHLSEFAKSGGLLSYGTDRADLFRRAAGYVDKILKGAKPGDLPVEQAIKFELILNLRTARAIGLTVPQSILARADEVIE